MGSEIAILSKDILGTFYLLMRILKKKLISEVNEKQFLKSDSNEEKLTEILNLVKKKKLLKKTLKHSTLNSTQEIAKILLLTITILHKMTYQVKDLQGFLSFLP